MSHRGGARGGARGGGPSRSPPQPPGGSPPEESRKYRDRAEERRRGIFMADDDEAPPAYNGNGSAHDAAGAGAGAGGVATYTSAAAKSILEASSDDDDDDPASAHLRYAPIAAPAAATIDAATPSIFTPTLPAPAPAPAPAAARENSEPVFIPASKVHFMTAFARSVYDAAVSLPLQLRHGVPHPPALDEGTGPAKGSDRFLRGRQGLIFDTAAAPLQGALGTEALRAAELRGLSTPAASLPTAMTRAKETVVMHLALHLPSSNTSSSSATLSSSSSSSSAAAAAAATMLASGASGSIMTASLDASSDKHAGATGLRGSDAVIPLPARMDTDMLAKVHRAIEGRRRQLAGEVMVSSSGAGSAARTNAEKIAEADAAKKKKEEEEAAAAAATAAAAAAANDDEFDIFADAGEYKPSYAVDATPVEVSSSSSSSSSAAKAAAEAERLYSHESSSSADTASLFGPHTSATSTSSTSHSTTTTSSSSSRGVRSNHDDSHLLSSLSGFGAASLTRPRARTALRVAADGSIVAAEEADDAEYAAAVAAETGAIVELGREGLAELRERAEAAGAAVEGGRGRKRERDGAAPGGSGDDDEEGDGIDSSGRGGRGGAFDADADKRRREQRFESEFSALAKRLDIKTTGGGTEEGAEQTSKRARVLGMRR